MSTKMMIQNIVAFAEQSSDEEVNAILNSAVRLKLKGLAFWEYIIYTFNVIRNEKAREIIKNKTINQ